MRFDFYCYQTESIKIPFRDVFRISPLFLPDSFRDSVFLNKCYNLRHFFLRKCSEQFLPDPSSESRFLARWLPTATFSLFPSGFPSGFLPDFPSSESRFSGSLLETWVIAGSEHATVSVETVICAKSLPGCLSDSHAFPSGFLPGTACNGRRTEKVVGSQARGKEREKESRPSGMPSGIPLVCFRFPSGKRWSCLRQNIKTLKTFSDIT